MKWNRSKGGPLPVVADDLEPVDPMIPLCEGRSPTARDS